MNAYIAALSLIQEAAALMESINDTLIAAHLSTPMSLIECRLRNDQHSDDG